jgi:hypothetical protein
MELPVEITRHPCYIQCPPFVPAIKVCQIQGTRLLRSELLQQARARMPSLSLSEGSGEKEALGNQHAL